MEGKSKTKKWHFFFFVNIFRFSYVLSCMYIRFSFRRRQRPGRGLLVRLGPRERRLRESRHLHRGIKNDVSILGMVVVVRHRDFVELLLLRGVSLNPTSKTIGLSSSRSLNVVQGLMRFSVFRFERHSWETGINWT
jgi:hypothetical protein